MKKTWLWISVTLFTVGFGDVIDDLGTALQDGEMRISVEPKAQVVFERLQELKKQGALQEGDLISRHEFREKEELCLVFAPEEQGQYLLKSVQGLSDPKVVVRRLLDAVRRKDYALIDELVAETDSAPYFSDLLKEGGVDVAIVEKAKLTGKVRYGGPDEFPRAWVEVSYRAKLMKLFHEFKLEYEEDEWVLTDLGD